MYIHHVSLKILRVFKVWTPELPGFHALPVHIHIFQHLHHQPSSTGDE